MSRWAIVPLQRKLGQYARAWDELNARAFGRHPLLDSRVIENMLRNFGGGNERLCVLEEQGQVQAMCILRPRNALVWASFLPAQAQIGATLIPDVSVLPSLWNSLPSLVIQLDLLCNDPETSSLLAPRQPPTHRLNHALTMKVALSGTFAEYWAARSKHLQSNIKRYQKRVQVDGLAPRFTVITAADQIRAGVERYMALEGTGWKGRAGTALSSQPAQYRFYNEIMLRAADSGNAIVYELWFGEQLVASRLAVCRQGMQVMLKTSYDESFATYSPGRLLLFSVIEHAFAGEDHQAIEFYTDADPNQLEWATGRRWIAHETLYRWPCAEILTVAMRTFKTRPARRRRQGDHKKPYSIDAYDHPDALPRDVQDFLGKAEKRNIAFGLSWSRNLVTTVYAAHAGIRYYVLRHADQVVAVLPLRAEKMLLGWQLNSLSNFYTALYEPVLGPGLKPNALLPVLAAVQQDFNGLASFKLTPMDPGSDAYRTLLGALRLNGWFSFEYFGFGNWYLPVTGTWTDYLATRKGTLRSTIKRMTKKFAGDGGTLEIVTDSRDIPRAIAAYEAVYAASWKNPEPFPGFMPGLLQLCADKGFLRLGLAWLDGQPIAAQVWIVSHGRAEIYKVAYHEAFKAYAPGTLVTAMLMEYATETDRVSEVDYLIGDDPYKETWMSHRRERWGIVAYNPTSLRGLLGLAYEVAGRAVKALRKRYPARQDS
ncbi:MAG: GNAT family N-acetyltransferase [Pseudomonadota bacterium]